MKVSKRAGSQSLLLLVENKFVNPAMGIVQVHNQKVIHVSHAMLKESRSMHCLITKSNVKSAMDMV